MPRKRKKGSEKDIIFYISEEGCKYYYLSPPLLAAVRIFYSSQQKPAESQQQKEDGDCQKGFEGAKTSCKLSLLMTHALPCGMFLPRFRSTGFCWRCSH